MLFQSQLEEHRGEGKDVRVKLTLVGFSPLPPL